MLYSEFVSGTGCRENEHNYKVYRDLEIMYMNSDMSKEEIYEYGKKLVDNAEPEELRKLKADLRNQLNSLKEENKRRKGAVEYYKWALTRPLEDVTKNNIQLNMAYEKKQIRENNIRIKEIRFILG